MKGRNTTLITLRLDDVIVKSLEEKAKEQGLATAGAYIKSQILKSYSVIATNNETYKVIGGVRYMV